MAACLALKGHRVLLLDLDPQGGATVQIGLGKRSLDTTIHQALLGERHLSEVVHRTEIDNVDIAPANMALDGAKVEMDKKLSRETILKRMLANIDGYDYSIVDCEPGLTILTLNALVACDDVIIPLQAEYNSLEGTADLMQTLKDVAEILGHRPRRRFLITMVSKTVHSREVIDILREEFKEEVYETMIPRNISVAEAPAFGKPVVLYAPNSPGAQAYMKLTEEFLNG
jgi:chromosome partitioning protein